MKPFSPDILFVQPNASKEIYQDLSRQFSAIEPPIWAAMLANHIHSRKFRVELMDCEALDMDDKTALHHITHMRPLIVCFVVYGQQPSASSQNMEGAVRLAEKIKQENPRIFIAFVGGHVSALPEEVLNKHSCIDFACQDEGVYTLSHLVRTIRMNGDVYYIPGLVYRTSTGVVIQNKPSSVVPKEFLGEDLPGMFWDLLPKTFYRTSLWHSYSNNAERQPFAALYTSLGCPYSCSFCCINAPFGGPSFRYWQPEFIINEFDKIAKMGVRNIKIADELFVLNPAHFIKVCELLIERAYNFNIWCYARVDITKPEYLEKLKKAGVNWLALGIESSNLRVRKDVIKGRFENVDIRGIVSEIRNHGINVMGNYIFGLPEDDHQSMRETFDLAVEMNTEGANFYSAMAYPGSKLYNQAVEANWKLPETYAGFSQHSYECQPLPTKYLQPDEVLRFRDWAWQEYHNNPTFLAMIRDKFGDKAVNDTVASTKIKLKRKILGD